MTVEFSLGNLGDPFKGTLGVGLPLLLGVAREPLLDAASPGAGEEGLRLWTGPEGLAGFARLAPQGDLEKVADRIYRAIFRASSGMSLYRIWNFVPNINGEAREGIENYRAFCRGRSLAFESALGPDFTRSLPAASAVGSDSPELTVVFLSGHRPVRHFENPLQVPAYEYPPEHGPRPPSFSRATVVDKGHEIDVYVSGTSSVVGHETVAPDDTAGQLKCTFENLRLIAGACGFGRQIGTGGACRRHFKVYLRNASDLGLVSGEMTARGILSSGDSVSYLRGDICRSALNVEIEVAVRGADRI